MKTAKAKYLWLALIGAGILANFCLHQYRFHLYHRNPDYPEFDSLQRLQHALFWATVAVIVAAAARFVWARFVRRG